MLPHKHSSMTPVATKDVEAMIRMNRLTAKMLDMLLSIIEHRDIRLAALEKSPPKIIKNPHDLLSWIDGVKLAA